MHTDLSVSHSVITILEKWASFVQGKHCSFMQETQSNNSILIVGYSYLVVVQQHWRRRGEIGPNLDKHEGLKGPSCWKSNCIHCACELPHFLQLVNHGMRETNKCSINALTLFSFSVLDGYTGLMSGSHSVTWRSISSWSLLPSNKREFFHMKVLPSSMSAHVQPHSLFFGAPSMRAGYTFGGKPEKP